MEINGTIIVSAISFIIFIFIMNSLLYEPILKIVQQRNEYVDNNKDQAVANKNKADGLIEDKNKKITEHHKKSRDIVAATVESLKEEKSRMLGNTKSDMANYFNSKKQAIAGERDNTVDNLAYNVADIANNITTKLVGYGVAFEPLEEDEVKEVIRKNA